MITYNDIYEASKNERYSDQLQKIDESFIEDVKTYLREKKEIAAKEDNVFSDVILKSKKQLENAITLFKEFMLRRRKKILKLVLIAAETGISKQDFENMFDFEQTLFEEIMKNIEVSDKEFAYILSGKLNDGEAKEKIRFVEDVGELMDFEGSNIGPFKKGDEAEISREIVKILIGEGKVERV
jgi:DNA replication initiation complex subunit (GINS family)